MYVLEFCLFTQYIFGYLCKLVFLFIFLFVCQLDIVDNRFVHCEDMPF